MALVVAGRAQRPAIRGNVGATFLAWDDMIGDQWPAGAARPGIAIRRYAAEPVAPQYLVAERLMLDRLVVRVRRNRIA